MSPANRHKRFVGCNRHPAVSTKQLEDGTLVSRRLAACGWRRIPAAQYARHGVDANIREENAYAPTSFVWISFRTPVATRVARFFSSSVVFVKVEFVLHMRDAARRLLQQEAYPSIGMIKFLPAMTKTIQDFELRLSPQRPVTPNKFHGVQTHGYERIVITVYM